MGSSSRLLVLRAEGTGVDQGLEVRVVGEHEREALPAARVDDAVHGGMVSAVRPAFEQIADVDDERAGHRWHRRPFAVAPLNLQSSDLVLAKHREHAEVGVRRHAELILLGALRLRRIVLERPPAHGPIAEPDEVIGVQTGAEREAPQQVLRASACRFEVRIDTGLELRHRRRPDVRTEKGIRGRCVGVPLAARFTVRIAAGLGVELDAPVEALLEIEPGIVVHLR